MSAMQGRALLAVSALTRQRLLPCLAGMELEWAETAAQVCAAAAREHFDLFVVGSHFDESHTFDMVRKLNALQPGTRVVCVRGRAFPGLGPSTMHAFRAACEALGVSAVIDLFDFPVGETGTRAIRAIIEQTLAPDSRAGSAGAPAARA